MKWILKGTECEDADWISLVQGTGTSGGSCENGKWASGFLNTGGNFLTA